MGFAHAWAGRWRPLKRPLRGFCEVGLQQPHAKGPTGPFEAIPRTNVARPRVGALSHGLRPCHHLSQRAARGSCNAPTGLVFGTWGVTTRRGRPARFKRRCAVVGLCGQHNRPHRKGVDGPSGSCVDHTGNPDAFHGDMWINPKGFIHISPFHLPFPFQYKLNSKIQGFGPRHG